MARPPRFAPPVPNRTYNITPTERMRPEEDPNNYSRYGDAWQMSWMKQTIQELEEQFAEAEEDPNFRGMVPEGYEEYASAFKDARSQRAVDTIKSNIDANLDARLRREKRGIGNTIVSDLVVGIADPTNLIAGPAMLGKGVYQGAKAGLVGIGAIGAATEVVRVGLDATAPIEEMVGGVIGSAATGAGLGAILGAIGRSTGRAAAKPLGAKVTQVASFPVSGNVSSTYGRRKAPIEGATTDHKALDVAAPLGAPVRAPLNGTVLEAKEGYNGGRGNYVIIDHGGGLVTRYYHLNNIDVKPGMRIKQDTQLGAVGSTGRSTGPHLHYEALLNGKNFDPRRIGVREVREGADDLGPVDARLAGYRREGIDPPATIDFNGRGIKVVNAATNEVDAEGRPILALFRRAKQREVEADGLGRAATVTADSSAALKQTPLEKFFGVGEGEAVEASGEAVTRARLEAIEDADEVFFASLKPLEEGDDTILEAARTGADLTVRARKRLGKIIKEGLATEEQIDAFFGGARPAKLTLKAIDERLVSETAKRKAERAGAGVEPRAPLRVERGKIEPDLDEERVARLAEEARVEARRLREGTPTTPAAKAALEEQAGQLEKLADDYEDQLDFAESDWVRGADDADGAFKPLEDGPVLETAEDALAELRAFDAKKRLAAFEGEETTPAVQQQPRKYQRIGYDVINGAMRGEGKGITAEDALSDIEHLELLQERGKLKRGSLNSVELGRNMSTGDLNLLYQDMDADPVGTLRELRAEFEARVDKPVAAFEGEPPKAANDAWDEAAWRASLVSNLPDPPQHILDLERKFALALRMADNNPTSAAADAARREASRALQEAREKAGLLKDGRLVRAANDVGPLGAEGPTVRVDDLRQQAMDLYAERLRLSEEAANASMGRTDAEDMLDDDILEEIRAEGEAARVRFLAAMEANTAAIKALGAPVPTGAQLRSMSDMPGEIDKWARERETGAAAPDPIDAELDTLKLVDDAFDDDDRLGIATAFEREAYDDDTRKLFRDEVRLAIANGIDTVREALREYVKRAINAIAAVAVVFNPVALTPAPAQFDIATVVSRTAVPDDVSALMTPAARYTFETQAQKAKDLGKGFIIADKPAGKIHLFGADGRHISTSNALYGKVAGDSLEGFDWNSKAVPTEAGTSKLGVGENQKYTGGKTLRMYDEYGNWKLGLAVHSVYLGRANENRLGRLASDTVGDNKISSGCINTTQETFLNDVLPNIDEFDGGLVFTLPEKAADTGKFFEEGTVAAPAGSKPLSEGELPGGGMDGILRGERGASQTMRREGGGTRRKGFRTAKGSTYKVEDDGTTVRDKAARPEHPGEQGVQPKSEQTFYVSTADAQKLGEIQTQGAGANRVIEVRGDQAGIKYVDGKDAGKFEKRTVVSIQTEPGVGLIPVELWKGGARVHFGNEIVEMIDEVSPPPPPRAAPEPERPAPSDIVDEDADSIILDIDGILASFDEKPWTRPSVAGATPLPEDAFATASEWLNFVYHRELEQTVNPVRDGETMGAYTDRITNRALEEIRAQNLPLSPERGFLNSWAIAPLIHGQLDRLVPQESLIWEKMQALSSDGAVTLVANNAGRAAIPGGSVAQRRMMWEAEYGEFVAAVDSLWYNYTKGAVETPTSGKMVTVKATLARIGRGEQGKMSRPQFAEAVGFAINNPDAKHIKFDTGETFTIPPQVGEAVRRHAESMQRFEKAAEAVGLFKMDRELELQEAWLRQRLVWSDEQLARMQPDDARARLNTIRSGYQAELDAIASLRAMPRRPSGSENYQHRIWNMRALTDRKDAAIAMFANVRKQRALDRNEVIDDDTARQLGEKDYDAILNAPVGDGVPGSPGATKGRTIDITNAEAWEFIVKDPEINLAMYARRMGSAIEMARTFGDARAQAVTDQIEIDLLNRGVPRDKVDQAMQLWFDQVDRVNGGFHGAGHMNMTNRVVRVLKQYLNLTAMGEAVKSQVPDLGRVIGVVGPNPIMRQLVSAMQGDMKGLIADGSYAKQAGEAWDLAMARAMAAIIDFDDYQLVTMQSGLERALQKANPAFFIANLMTPWSILQKEFAGNMVPHLVLERAKKIAASIRAGEEPDAKLVKQLAALNIDRIDAQILADMDVEQTPGGLMLPNLGAWAATGERGARAAMLMRGAVNTEVRRMVPTPGSMDRPAVSDGIIHSPKGMREGRARVEAAQIRLAEAAQTLERLSDPRQSVAEEVLEEAAEAVTAAKLELAAARGARPQAGRIEAPLLSLPFQFGSFLIGASGKITHGLISNRDNARMRIIFTMLAAGAVSTWWKTHDNPDEKGVSQWDRMEWTEVLWNSFDNSGVLGYFHKVGPAIESTLKMAGVDVRGTDYDKDSWSQEIGTILGPVAGQVTALYEAMAGISDNKEKVRLARRSIPGNNLIEIEGWVTAAERMLAGDAYQPGELAERDDSPMRLKEDTTLDKLFGLGGEDLRRKPELVEEAPLYGGETEDIDALVERIMARKRAKEGKRPSKGSQPKAAAEASPVKPLKEGNLGTEIRYRVKNKDGSISTVRTISIGVDDGEVLLPTVINNRVVSDEEAIEHYEKTGENFGTFKTPQDATRYGEWLHKQHEAQLR